MQFPGPENIYEYVLGQERMSGGPEVGGFDPPHRMGVTGITHPSLGSLQVGSNLAVGQSAVFNSLFLPTVHAAGIQVPRRPATAAS